MAQANNKFSVFGENSTKLTDEVYQQLQQRLKGNEPGQTASASMNNTALYQMSVLVVGLAEFIAAKLTSESIDSTKTPEQIGKLVTNAINSMIPNDLGDLSNDAGYSKTLVYSGTSEPTSELGKDGDLYVKFE